jgi:hypothetical protein
MVRDVLNGARLERRIKIIRNRPAGTKVTGWKWG